MPLVECPLHPGFHVVGKYGCAYCDMLKTSYAEAMNITLSKAGRTQQRRKMRSVPSQTTSIMPAPAPIKGTEERKLNEREKREAEFPLNSVWGCWKVISLPDRYNAPGTRGVGWGVRCERIDYPTVKQPLGSQRVILLRHLRKWKRE